VEIRDRSPLNRDEYSLLVIFLFEISFLFILTISGQRSILYASQMVRSLSMGSGKIADQLTHWIRTLRNCADSCPILIRELISQPTLNFPPRVEHLGISMRNEQNRLSARYLK
jgi:hypothetical protein